MNTFMQKIGVLTLMLSAFVAACAYDFEAGGIYYNITNQTENRTVEVTFADTEYSGDITVPTSVTYNDVPYAVTAIGNEAFGICSGLTSISIPGSVTTIGEGAFRGCTKLKSITIPNAVTTIGKSAFFSCFSLGNIYVESENPAYSSVEGVLYNKSGTTLICFPSAKTGDAVIPEGVITIGANAFAFCTNITSVTIPNSVTTIGDFAFGACLGLTSVDIPDSVTTIGDEAFNGCTRLTAIVIPNSVTSVGKSAFNGCTKLASISIPNSITTIEDGTFSDCESLTSITIPNSVTTIGGLAFSFCTGLTSITIPGSVTTIGKAVFKSCVALENIYVEADNPAYSSVDGVLYNKSGTTLICFPAAKTGEAIIPQGVTAIDDYALGYCTGLTAITIPNSVTTIGDGAFSTCIGLTSIAIPNSVTTIGVEAFFICIGLTSIAIPNSVTTIGKSAFSYCIGLTSVTSLAVTPPVCDGAVFDAQTMQDGILYVPAGRTEAYRLAEVWKDFANIEDAGAGIEAAEAAADGTAEVFTLAGVKVADSTENLPAGIYLVRRGSSVRKLRVK